MRSTILLDIKHTLVHIEALFGARSRVGSSSQSTYQDEFHDVLDTPYRLFVQAILGAGNYCLNVTHPNPNPNSSERGRTSGPEFDDSLPVLLSM